MMPEPEDWSPDPALLAAYFDGELDGRPELAPLRRRLEVWLDVHPEAREVLADYQRLAQLWHYTSPPDPGAAAWKRLKARVAAAPARRLALRGWAVALLATAAGVALVVWIGLTDRPTPKSALIRPVPPRPTPEAVEVFPVATAAEVVILRVEGADTQTLVVGELPVHGPLELLGPGEVALMRVSPDTRDQMLPHVRMKGPHRPLIWARADAEIMPP
jgi:hypothetical protein